MKWSLLELNKYKDDALQFNELLDVEASLLARDKEILAVAPVKLVVYSVSIRRSMSCSLL